MSGELRPDQFGQQYNADPDKSKWSGESPQDSRRAHSRADTDISSRSLHHTLGTKHNQASPGDHNHDGTSSKLIGAGSGWTIPISPSVADLVTLLHKFVDFEQE